MKIAMVLCLLALFTTTCYADDCATVETNSIALSFAELAQARIKPSTIYTSKVAEVKSIADTLKLKNFNVTATNTSVNKNSYGPQDQIEIYISLTIEFDYFPEALDSFSEELNPTSISMATTNYEVCNDCSENKKY